MIELDRLGRDVREELGEPSANWLRKQRRELASALELQPRSQLDFRRWGPPLALLAVAVAALLTVLSRARPTPSAAAELALTAPNAERRVPLADGSSLLLAAHTRARVQTNADGTLCKLEVGTVHFDVAPQKGRQFSVVAGDFAVRVVGTRFSVSLDAAGSVEVAVTRGELRVDTPTRNTPTELRAGDWLWGHGAELVLRHSAPPADSAEPTAVSTPAATVAEPTPPPVEAPLRSTSASKTTAIDPDWLARYRQRDYAAALAAARQIGIDGLLESLAVQPLSELADAARLGGDRDLALRAFAAIGRRFPTSRQAGDALFLSGRLFATQGRSGMAQRQFEAYLARSEHGAYSVEATGRLVEIYAANRDARTKPTARVYLDRAPDGPYQQLCRSVLAAP
jgi:TolA-binding protein